MKKIIYSIFIFTCFGGEFLLAQVGINTSNIEGVLHIDGAKDNPNTVTASIAQQQNDVVVTAQGQLGIGTNAPHAVAALEINSTSTGFMPTRMTNLQMLAIPTPAQGLVVYCTNCTPKGLRVFDGTYWTDMMSTNPKSKILFQWDFEGSTPFNNLSFEQTGTAITVVSDPLNSNNKVMKAELLPGNDRTEVSLTTTALQLLYIYTDADYRFRDAANTVTEGRSIGSEIWVSMRIFKPQEQNTNGIKPSIFQFGPTRNQVNFSTLSSRGFWQLRIRNDTGSYGDRWNSRLFGDVNYTPMALNSETNFVLKPYGVWEKFVFHLKYRSDSEGVLEVWKDGVKYITISGQNAYAFNQNRIKWGVYLGVGNSVPQYLSCYFDDIKIGGANCSYEEINQ
jgi:hypothetical protein